MKTNLGRVLIIPKGEWSFVNQYNKLDLVSYNGSSFVCKRDEVIGTPLTDATTWMIVAQKGDSFTYGDLTDLQKKEISQDATIAAERAAGYAQDVRDYLGYIANSDNPSEVLVSQVTQLFQTSGRIDRVSDLTMIL